MGLVPEEPGPSGEIAGQRELLSRLRAVVEAKDAENAVLRPELDAERELRRRLELRLAELERRLSMDSSDSGTPSSKERIGAKQARRARQQSERERRRDRKRGGQPGHQGKGLARDPDPDEKKDAEPPAECRQCRAALDGAAAAGSRWAQVIDVEVIRTVTEWALPGRACPCCGAVTFAEPPPGAHAGSVSYGPVLNAAAVVLTAYGNVPPERAAQVMAMLLGVAGLAGLGGQGQRPPGGAAGEGRVRRGDARGAGRGESAGRGRDPGERAGQAAPRSPPRGRTGKKGTPERRRRRRRAPRTC